MINMITGKKTRLKTLAEIEEEKFILAVNSLKTLRAPFGGCISIDVDEIRDQVIADREWFRDYMQNKINHQRNA